MKRFDGTAARQLELLEEVEAPARPAPASPDDAAKPRPLRLMQRDVYAELTRRRRRAQIRARHLADV